jgi:glycosyltransferase involved in cell wall biosynthesis
MRVPDTGRVVGDEDPRELSAVVVELLTDHERRTRMGQAARQWVIEEFDWAPLGRSAQRVFGEVMR